MDRNHSNGYNPTKSITPGPSLRLAVSKGASVLAVQRHHRILSRAETEGCVRVTELARELSVTEETIRRDLKKLDEDGKLHRIHGGAIVVSDPQRALPLDVRETVFLEEKRAIARRAIEHITAHEVIALDASSTAHEVAKLLPDIELTVVTNSLTVLRSLASSRNLEVISTGGRLDRLSLSFTGVLAEQSLLRFNISKLFFSAQGVDPSRGLSVADEAHARIKHAMVRSADTSILLADNSKIGVRAAQFFAAVDEIEVIISNFEADPDAAAAITERGVRLEYAS